MQGEKGEILFAIVFLQICLTQLNIIKKKVY